MRALLAWTVVAAAAATALVLCAPPEPRGPDAPETAFAAARAFPHVERVAVRPHAVRTAANAEVREYVVAQLRHLGLDVSVRRAASRLGWPVENVLAKLPGHAPTGVVAVACHYDSVPTGPGAGDDGAAVAAVLETARALSSGEPPANDVWFLLTDGEEAGLLGAHAFLGQDPEADRIDVVLNFEARGTSGRSLMFETSPGNRALVEAYAKACPRPASCSLMVEFYRRMPNDTDFTEFRRHGIRGLNFAFIDGYWRYHTEHDTPEHLSHASLQHHGEAMLGLVRELGARDLRALPHDEDAVYFDVLGRGFVQYPAGWAWALTVGVGLLFVLAVGIALRAGALRPAGLGWSVLAVLRTMVYAAVVVGGAGYLALEVLGDTGGPVRGSAKDPFLFLGTTLVALAVANATMGTATARHGRHAAAAGALLVLLVLLGASNAVMVGATFVSLFPLALLLAAWCAALRIQNEVVATAVALPYVVAMALLLAPLVDLLFLGLALERSVFHAPLLGLWLAAPVPFLDRAGGGWRRPVVWVPAALGVVLFAVGLL